MKKITKPAIKNKKILIFDMDGTMIDSIGVWNNTDQELIKQFGGPTVELDRIQHDRDMFLNNNRDSDIYAAYMQYLIEKYALKEKNSIVLLDYRWKVSNRILENDMEYKPGIPDLLYALKEKGFILVLATMTTETQLNIYMKKNQKMISSLNLPSVFDFIVTKELVHKKKPDPEIYELILNHYDSKPEECIVFEDSLLGVLAAKAAGIEVITVYDKYSDTDRTRINELTDYYIQDCFEVLQIL